MSKKKLKIQHDILATLMSYILERHKFDEVIEFSIALFKTYFPCAEIADINQFTDVAGDLQNLSYSLTDFNRFIKNYKF